MKPSPSLSPPEPPECARLNYLLPIRSARSPAPLSPVASASDISSDVRSAVPFLWEQTPGRCKSSSSAADFYLHCTPPPSPPAAPVTLASLFRQSSPDLSSAASVATSEALTATDNALNSSPTSPRQTVPRSSSYARHVIVNRFLPAVHAICSTDSPAMQRGGRSFRRSAAPTAFEPQPGCFHDNDNGSTDEEEEDDDDDDEEEESGIIASMGACGFSCTFRVAGAHLLFDKKSRGRRRRRLVRPSYHPRDSKHQWHCGELQKEANKGNYHKSNSLPLHELMVKDDDQPLYSQANGTSLKQSYYPQTSHDSLTERSRLEMEKTFESNWSHVNNGSNMVKGNDNVLNNGSLSVVFPPLPKSPSHSWLEKAIPMSLKNPSPLSQFQKPKKEHDELTKWQTIVMKANHLQLDHLRSSKELLWEAKNTMHIKE